VVPGHGAAQAGLLGPSGNEDLEYFEWPYPPPSNGAERVKFDRCIGASVDAGRTILAVSAGRARSQLLREILGGATEQPMPPVAVDIKSTLHTDQRAGAASDGTLSVSIPDAVFLGDAGAASGFDLPAGTYKITVRGTAAGPEELVFTRRYRRARSPFERFPFSRVPERLEN
jgi:hypothetical protein